jgi:mevalonate kinase
VSADLAVGRGLGKLIVLGEHAVVYGHRAVAAAVSLGTTVRLARRPGPTALTTGPFQDPRLARALAVALPADGVGVSIQCELPVGRGMGSSAALTVALLRARAALDGQPLSPAALHAQGFALERIFHGDPSGLDHAVSAMGGAVVYRKGAPPAPVNMPPTSLVVLDSGSAGDTAALVGGVASRRPAVDPWLDRLGALVEETLPHLGDPARLGAAMDEAHAALRQIGVSTPRLDAIVALAKGAGAIGAKLSGAGGGGIVIALTPDGPESVLRAARDRDIAAFSCTLPANP